MLISEKIKKVALTLKKHRQPERRPENNDKSGELICMIRMSPFLS